MTKVSRVAARSSFGSQSWVIFFVCACVAIAFKKPPKGLLRNLIRDMLWKRKNCFHNIFYSPDLLPHVILRKLKVPLKRLTLRVTRNLKVFFAGENSPRKAFPLAYFTLTMASRRYQNSFEKLQTTSHLRFSTEVSPENFLVPTTSRKQTQISPSERFLQESKIIVWEALAAECFELVKKL